MLENLRIKDAFGIQPIANVVEHDTDKTIDGVSTFLEA